jgi:hypothetical protein
MSLKQTEISETYRGINEFKNGYQHRTDLVKDENGVLLDNSHNILNRWKNYFCQLLNVHGVTDIRQIKMYRAEPSVPETNCFQVDIAIEKLKMYKSPDINQIPANLTEAGGNTLYSEIQTFNSI